MKENDPFRKVYTPLNDIQRALISDVKDQACELLELLQEIDKNYDARCAHIAKTKLEEAVMWAVKATSVKVSS